MLLTTPTVVSLNLVAAATSNASTASWTATFSETVTGVDPTDFALATSGTVGATLTQVTGSGSIYKVTVSGITGAGTLGLNVVDNDSIKNATNVALGGAGVNNGNFTGQVETVDHVSPSVVSLNRTNSANAATNASSASFTATFSEAVTGVDPTDFSIIKTGTIGTTLTQVTGSGSVYKVTVSGITGVGTLGLNLVDDLSIRDLAGNSLVPLNSAASFSDQATFTAGSLPRSLTIGDVNGDGKPDLAVANYNSSTVSVLLGNGNGTFTAQQTFSTGVNPTSMTLGDVNGDGKPDLIVANFGSNSVSVLLGNGNGTFTTQQTFAVGALPDSVVLGDVNGDGKLDLTVANRGSNTVSVLLGNGNGTFTVQQTFATGTFPASVTLGDVNGDGKPDLAVANSFSSSLSLLLGNGDGTFIPQKTFATGTNPRSTTLGDVNGDGKPDLAVVNYGSNTVSVLLGNGNGTFAAQQTFATGTGPTSVVLGDVNGDGKPDLAVANFNSNTVSVLTANGNGTFSPQQTFTTGTNSSSLVLGDVNGDSRSDLAVANWNGNSVSVLLGNANGNFTGQVYTVDQIAPSVVSINRLNPVNTTTNASSVSFTAIFSEAVTGVDPTDFSIVKTGTIGTTLTQVTGSGSFYTVTVSGITGVGTIGLNLVDDSSIRDLSGNPLVTPNASANFSSQATFGAGTNPTSVKLSDVNGDGNPDLVTANYNSNTVSVLLGNGNGTFGTQQTFATGTNPQTVAWGDLNGDGLIDLVVGNVQVATVSVLLGNGNGTFKAQQTFATGIGPRSVTLSDVNGDGKPDLIVANDSSGSVGVLLGNGNGTFASQLTFATGAFPHSVTVGDVNRDGRPDLILANSGSNTVSILLGNGNGTFASQQTFATGAAPESVTVGDVNGDGNPDLVVTNVNSANVSLLLGNGNGTFQLQQTFAAGSNPGSVTMGDLNGDGKTDLVVANGGSNTLSLLLGNGNGTFAVQQTFATGASPRSVALGDVNGDGRPDLTVANSGSNSVCLLLGNSSGNFTGQVYTIDPTNLNVAPSVVSINRTSPANATTNASNVSFTVTFSEPVSGVDPTDFSIVKTGTIGTAFTQVTGSGSVYTVTVSGITGAGTLGLNLIDDSSIRDLAGNSLVPLNAAASFASQTTFATGTQPHSTTIGDVNGDGKPDRIVANSKYSNVSVLLGNGDGTFASLQTFATGSFPYSVTLGDVNGDGKPDIAVTNYFNTNVSVLLGNGDGTFAAQQTFVTGLRPISVVLGDVNGDGKPDLIVANKNSYTVSVLLGNGNGTFATQKQFATGKSPWSVVLGDLNGDGKPDLAVANEGDNTVSVLLGNSNGTFADQQTFVTGSSPVSVVLGDVNGDGRPDLAVANLDGKSGSLLLGNNNDNFTGQSYTLDQIAPTVVSINRTNPASATTGVNSVSFTATFSEAVTGVDPTDFAIVKTGTVNSTLTQVIPVSTSVYTVTVSGISGVGTLGLNLVDDLSIRDLAGNSLVTPGRTARFANQATFATGAVPASVVLGDVNGDGKPDLVVANLGGNNISVLLGNGNGTFAAQQTFATGTSPVLMVLGDVNGDGKPDVVVANPGSNNVSVLLGNGNGTFAGQQTFDAGTSPLSMVLGDVNGDGIPDLAVANFASNTVSVLLGNGNGTFAARQTFATGQSPDSLALIDVNGDGKPDLVVANDASNSIGVLLGNGNGTFAAQQSFATGQNPTSLTVGDVNGDGKPDLAVLNQGSYTVSLLLGNGNGTFSAQQTIDPGKYPRMVVLGDVNGDGKPDLTVANVGNYTVSVLLGNGNGTFAAQQTFATVSGNAVTLGDVNGDGKPDLIAANYNSYSISILLNNANGNFTGQVYSILPLPTIITPTLANITNTSATLGGNVSSDGGQPITERGVVYALTSVNPNPQIGGTGVTKLIASGTTGAFTVGATSLTTGAVYSYVAYATNSVGTAYTSPVSTFTPGPVTVTGVYDTTGSNLVHVGDTLTSSVTSLSVAFSENMNVVPGGASSVTNPSNWRLTRYGIDVTNQISGITFALNPTTLQYVAVVSFAQPLLQGGYQLVVRQTIQDATGRTLDGDGDGVPGGDFRINFYVAATVGNTTDIGPWLYQIEDINTPLNAPAPLFTPVTSSLLVFDADSNNWTGATIQISVNYQSGEDVLGFVNTATPNITGAWNAATGTLTLSGTDTVSNYRTALRNVTYHNTSLTPNTAVTRTVDFQTSDGLLPSNVVSRNVAVIGSSIPAVISGVNGTGTFFQGDPALTLAANLVISAPNIVNLASATVSFTNWQGEDRLDFNNIFALQHTFTQDLVAHTATFTITGSDLVDHYQTLLRSVIYWDVSGAPVTSARVASFSVSDGLSTSNIVTRNTIVTAVNQRPTLTAIESTPLFYKANDPAFPAQPISATLLAGDPDSNNVTKATVQITSGYQNDANGNDVLAVTNQLGITGSFNAATGTLTLSGSSGVGNYRTALRSVTFSTSGSAVSTANRTLTIIATDDATPTPANSLSATRSVTVSTTNTPPALTGVPTGALAYVRGAAAAALGPNAIVSDADSINLTGAAIQVIANYQNGQDILAATSGSGITVSFDAASGTLTLSGTSSLANYQTVLRSVTYKTNTSAASTLTRTIGFTLNDGLAPGSTVIRNVTLS